MKIPFNIQRAVNSSALVKVKCDVETAANSIAQMKFWSRMTGTVCGNQRTTTALSDHSRHLYCSLSCGASRAVLELRNI